MLAPSLLAKEGSGCVSMKMPSAPTAIAAFPTVEIRPGQAASDSACLVRLLQGMGYIHDYGTLALGLHDRYSAIIHYQVRVAESRASLRDAHLRVSGLTHLVHGMRHGLGREELTLLYVDHLSGLGRRHEQVCLSARKAGICIMSTKSAAMAASQLSWMSVTTGTPKRSLTFASMVRAFISPMPVNESSRLRLAFR